MKKKTFIILLFVVACCLSMVACGDNNTDVNKATSATTSTPAATSTPKATDVIATKGPNPTATTTPEPTADPDEGLTFVDVVRGNPNVTLEALTQINGGHEIQKAFDNNAGTRWSSTIKSPFEPEEILIQFGYPVIVDGCSIKEIVDWGQTVDWEVQYYNEETKSWEIVYEDSLIEDGEYYEFDENTKPTYAIKLVVYSVTGAAVTYAEINFQGVFVDVPEGTAPKEPSFSLVEKAEKPENAVKLSGNWTYSATTNYSDDYAAHLAFDGNAGSRWSSSVGELPVAGQMITASFGSAIDVSGIILVEEKSWGEVTSYVIQAEVNGQWIDVYEGELVINGEYIAFNNKVSATGVRLVFEGATGSSVTFYEIELYN